MRCSSSFAPTLPAPAESTKPSWLARAPSTSTRWITKSSAWTAAGKSSAASAQGRGRSGDIAAERSAGRLVHCFAVEVQGARGAVFVDVNGVELVRHEVDHHAIMNQCCLRERGLFGFLV